MIVRLFNKNKWQVVFPGGRCSTKMTKKEAIKILSLHDFAISIRNIKTGAVVYKKDRIN